MDEEKGGRIRPIEYPLPAGEPVVIKLPKNIEHRKRDEGKKRKGEQIAAFLEQLPIYLPCTEHVYGAAMSDRKGLTPYPSRP